MSDEYISTDIAQQLSKYWKEGSKIIIYPFISKSSEIITLDDLHCVPTIFTKSKQQKVDELCFRDIYFRDVNGQEEYVTIRRTPVDIISKSLIEIVTEKKTSADCFPMLSKYDNVKNYTYYKCKMVDNIYFKLTDINGKKFFSVEITSIDVLTSNNINKLCRYLDKISNNRKQNDKN